MHTYIDIYTYMYNINERVSWGKDMAKKLCIFSSKVRTSV